MATSTERTANWRARAKAAGLCITCCIQKPERKRSVCRSCTKAAYERKVRRTATLRKQTQLHTIIERYEKSGDIAREHKLYEEARQSYYNVLQIKDVPLADRLRISEKLAAAMFFGADSQAKSVVFDHQLLSCDVAPSQADAISKTFRQQAVQLWLDCRTGEAVSLLCDLTLFAERNGLENQKNLIMLDRAYYLQKLGRYREAEMLLLEIVPAKESEDPHNCAYYYKTLGMQAASRGDAETVFDCLEKAAQANPGLSPTYYEVSAHFACEFGDIGRAKALYETVLIGVQRLRIMWYIPFICLNYAEVLSLIGQHEAAYEYLRRSFHYDLRAPRLQELLATIGIPIALRANDEEALGKCANPFALEAAYRSGEPHIIASVTASFAQWHIAATRNEEAAALLHRAALSLRGTEVIEQWAFPVAVARFGSDTDIPDARRLLTSRVELPFASVAHAMLALFDAFVARRRSEKALAHYHATRAAQQFDNLGWFSYADLARTLLPNAVVPKREEKRFHETASLLTKRERDVADLVLRGYTNSVIAQMLGIKVRTVEAHMTSIMHRVGVRSRYQLDQLA